MINKRVRIWNSELAYRIDSQLTTQWDRAVFRSLLAQNELDERQLRNLLQRWRTQSNGKSLCEFLIDAELLLVEMRSPQTLDVSAYDSANEELFVSLTERARLEMNRERSLSVLIKRFLRGFLTRMFANASNSEAIGLTPTKQNSSRVETSSSSANHWSSDQPHIAVARRIEESTCPEPMVENANEFDPYATVVENAVEFDPYATVY